jgi:hypothetical protein
MGGPGLPAIAVLSVCPSSNSMTAAQARFQWSLASRTADLEAIQDGAAPHSG